MVVRLGRGGGVLRTISTLAHLGPVYPIGFSMEHAPFVYRRHARMVRSLTLAPSFHDPRSPHHLRPATVPVLACLVTTLHLASLDPVLSSAKSSRPLLPSRLAFQPKDKATLRGIGARPRNAPRPSNATANLRNGTGRMGRGTEARERMGFERLSGRDAGI